MRIEEIELKHISIPLKKPFKTALRTVETAENTVVVIHTDDGRTGFGEAPPTKVITGDTNESTIAAIRDYIRPALLGQDLFHLERIEEILQGATLKDFSAKAAVDMAIYDLVSQGMGVPLYQYLGGYRNQVETDLTISINEPEEMEEDAVKAAEQGFSALKLKVGIDAEKDVKRVSAIRRAVGPNMKIRLDANQGWEVEEAIRTICRLEDLDLNVELVEQPVKAKDLAGMKKVKENVKTIIMADESLFSPLDALQILQTQAADLLNIKLMKCGGIYNALKIVAIAETYGVECMLGSMVESKISLTAAAHLAAAKKMITRVDLDAAILLAEDPVEGGFEKNIPYFTLDESPGLGITGVHGMTEIEN